MKSMTSMRIKGMVTAKQTVNLRHTHLPQEHQNDKEKDQEISESSFEIHPEPK